MIIRHAHQSGHATATPEEQTAAGGMLARASDVAVETEALRVKAPEGWGVIGKETKILLNTAHWRAANFGTLVIPTGPWMRGTSHRSTVEITWAALRSLDVPDFTLLRFGGHLPAHLFRPAQRKANAAALAGLAPALAPVIAATSPDEVTGSLDFNRPLTSARHAKLITDAVAPLGLRLVVPPKATRGLRIIDGFLTTARLTEVGMLRRMPGYDHRGARMHTCADCAAPVERGTK